MKAVLVFALFLLFAVGNVEALAPPRLPRLSLTTLNTLPAFFQRRTETSRRMFDRRRHTTELGMGFRNILGKVTKRNNKDDLDSDEDDFEYESYDTNKRAGAAQPPPYVSPVSQIPPAPSPVQKEVIIPTTVIEENGAKKRPLRMGEDPHSKEINVNLLDQNESVQERINRVKAGKMTQEEKEAYLKAALSTGNTPETRLPLRPPAPAAEVDNKRARASPFPEDPILRSIAGGKDPAPAILSKQIIDNAGVDSQKKKREYLDMVTDPHRFDVFRSQPSRARLNPSSPAQGNLSGYQNLMNQNLGQQPPQYDWNIPSNENQYYSNQQSYSAPPSMSAPPQQAPMYASSDYDNSALDDTKTMSNTDVPDSDGFPSTDLAYRLEAAAHAQEQQREQQRKQQEEEMIRMKEQEQEEKRAAAAKAAEEERRRQEILAQREKEYRERRRREEEAAARESAKVKEEEEKRLKALLDAQESFWKQKLAKERELRERRLMEEQQNPPARQEPAPAPAQPSVVNLPPPKPSPSLGQNNLSKHVFNPDERNILNEAGEEAPSKREVKAAPPRPSINSYLNDVANNRMSPPKKLPGRRIKKDEEEMDEQLKRLKELNSPLPNVPVSRYDNKRKSAPVAFEPQRPASAYSPPKPTPGIANGAVNGSLPTNGESYQLRTPSPPPAPESPAAPARRSSEPAQSNPLNMIFGNQPAPTPAPTPKPAPRAASPPERKDPIRMQIPLNDDDSFDDEEGIDTTSNKKMSIADAMRKSGSSGSLDQEERSKKWGVDMSKFM